MKKAVSILILLMACASFVLVSCKKQEEAPVPAEQTAAPAEQAAPAAPAAPQAPAR